MIQTSMVKVTDGELHAIISVEKWLGTCFIFIAIDCIQLRQYTQVKNILFYDFIMHSSIKSVSDRVTLNSK